MILNVIDFNDCLKNSYRNRFCIYRNLEIGHEIHVYNENSKLIKACQSALTSEMKSNLKRTHYSPTYEYYKLFLMLNVGGWFIESDTIFYSKDLNPNKTAPTYIKEPSLFSISFCTWTPVFINLDSSTKFFLQKSLDTLKTYLEDGLFNKSCLEHMEFSYQIIFVDYGHSERFQNWWPELEGPVLNFCECPKKDAIHCATYLLDAFDVFIDKGRDHYEDFLLAKSYHEMDKEHICDEKAVPYDSLLKFDTFKIMP